MSLNIDATVRLSDIIKAAVHERIVSLEAEHEAAKEADNEASRAKESAWEAVSEHIINRPPESIRALIEAVGVVCDYGDHVIAWNEHARGVPEIITIEARRPRASERPGFVGLQSHFEVSAKLGPVDDELAALFAAFDAAHAAANKADAHRRNIAAMLADRGLRERLEGELISRAVSKQAPEVAALIDDLANDRGPRLITVGV